MKKQNMIYAIKGTSLVSIEDVPSGISCGCICPGCGEPLIARKGAKVMHHFAHKAIIDCEFGYQTSIHMASKDIISKSGKIMVPDLFLTLPGSGRRELIHPAREILVQNVTLEKKINNIIPDIILDTDEGLLILEIFVTHGIDSDKKKKIKKTGIPAIEINLSKIDRDITTELLKDILINGLENKTWVYNGLREHYFEWFYKHSERYPIVVQNHANHVLQCPLKMRKWKNTTYANFTDDCNTCDFFVYYYQKHNEQGQISLGDIWCSANQYIRHIQDYDIPFEERKRIYMACTGSTS